MSLVGFQVGLVAEGQDEKGRRGLSQVSVCLMHVFLEGLNTEEQEILGCLWVFDDVPDEGIGEFLVVLPIRPGLQLVELVGGFRIREKLELIFVQSADLQQTLIKLLVDYGLKCLEVSQAKEEVEAIKHSIEGVFLVISICGLTCDGSKTLLDKLKPSFELNQAV